MPSTATPEQLRALGRERLSARRRRTHRIRVTIASVAAAIFIAVFSTVYIQAATGNDPVLPASAAQTQTVASASTPAAAETAAGATTQAAAAPAATSPVQSSPAPVTTSQS